MAKKGGELVTTFTQSELRKAILDKVLSLVIVTWECYSNFGTMHEAVGHLNRWQ